MQSTSSSASLNKGQEQRKLRNLLIDSSYQMRYALFGGLITLVLCAVLALVVLWQSRSAHHTFTEQRTRATDLVRKQLLTNTKLVEQMRQDTIKDLEKVLQTATAMISIQTKSKETAVKEAALLAKQEMEKDDKERILREKEANKTLLAQRKKADREMVAALHNQDAEWLKQSKQQQQVLLVVILVFGLVVVLIIFLFNIQFSHKAAGPLFKIRRYIEQIREGHYGRIGTLRKGDHLVDFHEQFRSMHESLIEQIQADIQALESAIALLEQYNVTGPAMDALRKRLATKRSSLHSEEDL